MCCASVEEDIVAATVGFFFGELRLIGKAGFLNTPPIFGCCGGEQSFINFITFDDVILLLLATAVAGTEGENVAGNGCNLYIYLGFS